MSTDTGRVTCTHSQVTLEKAQALLQEFAGRAGWVCRTDGWTWWDGQGGTGSSAAPSNGWPLAAEFVESDTASVQLRRSGDDWLWTRIETAPADGPDADRRWNREFVSTEPGRTMRYEVWWTRDGDDAPVRPYRPFVARFTGWGAQKEESR